MSNRKLSLWRTLVHALHAPFGLEAASWKALSVPVLATIASSLVPVAVNRLQWNSTAVWLVVMLLIWVALAWLALEFQRHILLGAAACRANPQPWHRYGLYLVGVIVVCTAFAVFLGFLLQLVFPAIAFFSMAINSPDPWLSMGTVVLATLVAVAAAYPVVRISLFLPAVSVSQDISPKRIWRITKGNGLRLFSLLVLIPGMIVGLFAIVRAPELAGPWIVPLVGILNIYLFFVYLSILALAYRALSDQPLPTSERSSGRYGHLLYTRLLRPAGLVVLVGMGVVAGWDSFYRVEPGESFVVSRLGSPKRVETNAGIQLKIPFLEDAEPISETAVHLTKGEGTFLTMSKNMLPLKYEFQWHVADGNIFARALAGQTRHADMRIQAVANDMLRNQVSKLSERDVGSLRDAGRVEFFIGKGAHDEILLSGVLPDLNSRIAEMGLEINEWQIEMSGDSN